MAKFEDIALLSPEAYAFMCGFDAKNMADGRYELENGVYANVSTYTTRYRSESVYEAHRLYTDIQWIISGRELIATEPLETMHRYACTKQYDEQSDAELYENNHEGVDHLMEAGSYIVFPPEIAHMPNVCVDAPSVVRKVVVKVPVKA